MSYQELSRKQLEEALQEIDKELAETEKEKDEWESKAKKVKADFENYKKKQDDRKQKWQRQAQEKLAEDMIQIMDNLERAILTADEDNTVVKGVKMVADQLYQELEKRGLQKIDAEGEEFDPKLHKAVETKQHNQHKKILEQKRKGYMFEDKVLREAEVVVSENKKEQK